MDGNVILMVFSTNMHFNTRLWTTEIESFHSVNYSIVVGLRDRLHKVLRVELGNNRMRKKERKLFQDLLEARLVCDKKSDL